MTIARVGMEAGNHLAGAAESMAKAKTLQSAADSEAMVINAQSDQLLAARSPEVLADIQKARLAFDKERAEAADRKSRRRWYAAGAAAGLILASPFIVIRAIDYAGDTARGQAADAAREAANVAAELAAKAAPPVTGKVNSYSLISGIALTPEERNLVHADVKAADNYVTRNHIGPVPILGTGGTMSSVGEGSKDLKVENQAEAFDTSVVTVPILTESGDEVVSASTGAVLTEERIKTIVEATLIKSDLVNYSINTDTGDGTFTTIGVGVGRSGDGRRDALESHNIWLANQCTENLLPVLPEAVEQVVDAGIRSAKSVVSEAEARRIDQLTGRPMEVEFTVSGRPVDVLSIAPYIQPTGNPGIDRAALIEALKMPEEAITAPAADCTVSATALQNMNTPSPAPSVNTGGQQLSSTPNTTGTFSEGIGQ